MSGRRKLPQIPGQSSTPSSANNSRGPTPLGGPERLSDSLTEYNGYKLNDSNEDTSREPEGRSQNSSPATSLVRAPAAETWRELFALNEDEVKEKITEVKLLVSRLFLFDEFTFCLKAFRRNLFLKFSFFDIA